MVDVWRLVKILSIRDSGRMLCCFGEGWWSSVKWWRVSRNVCATASSRAVCGAESGSISWRSLKLKSPNENVVPICGGSRRLRIVSIVDCISVVVQWGGKVYIAEYDEL